MATTPVSSYRPFTLDVVPDRTQVTVIPSGELDLGSAPELALEVAGLQERGFARVVVDLREVDFMDSTGLRALLGLRNDALRGGRELALVPGPPTVQRLFVLTGTRGLFEWRHL